MTNPQWPEHLLQPRRPRAGFTLVELLVVIGIVAVLAGILLPVLSSVRRKAALVGCMSNLRQLSQALALYVNDFGDYFPQSFSVDANGKWRTVVDKLRPYVGVPGQLFACPADETGGAVDFSFLGLPRTSYSVNEALMPAGAPIRSGGFVRSSQAPRPGLTVAFYDAHTVSGPMGPDVAPAYRHDGRSTVAYVDGHIETHSRESPPAGYSADSFNGLP